jgi:Family of unknown function (DUF5670)
LTNDGLSPFPEGSHVFLIIAIILVILWAGGFFAFHVTSSLIHLLLILAIAAFIYYLVTGRRPVV